MCHGVRPCVCVLVRVCVCEITVWTRSKSIENVNSSITLKSTLPHLSGAVGLDSQVPSKYWCVITPDSYRLHVFIRKITVHIDSFSLHPCTPQIQHININKSITVLLLQYHPTPLHRMAAWRRDNLYKSSSFPSLKRPFHPICNKNSLHTITAYITYLFSLPQLPFQML